MQKTARRVYTALLASALTFLLACPSLAVADEVSDLASQTQTARAQLESIQDETEYAIDDYNGCVEAHGKAVEGMAEAQGRIDSTQTQIDSVKTRLTTRARAMYRADDSTFLSVLAGTEDFQDFIDKWDTLNTLNEDDAALVSQAKSLQTQAQQDKEDYAKLEQQASSQMMAASNAKTAVEAQIETYSNTLSSYTPEVQQAVVQQIQDEQDESTAASNAALDKYIENGGTIPDVSGSTSDSTSDESSDSGSSATTPDEGDSDDSDYSGGSSGSDIPSNGDVVSYAYSRLGCAYIWGATGPDTFDCSGLTSWCYAQCGVSIPRTSGGQRSGASEVLSVSDAEPGDVLWKGGHVGIYIGDGAYIHAPDIGEYVCVGYNMGQWDCALRF